MFFFQDDIGLLIQLGNLSFLKFLLTPQAEHFAPILHLLSGLEYHLFDINFFPYAMLVLFLHFINCFLIAKVVYQITNNKFYSLLAAVFFSVHLTYVEPLLWFSANGVVLATFFIGLAFLFWLKAIIKYNRRYFITSLFSTVLAGLSYGLGVGLGIIFSLATVVHNKIRKKRQTSWVLVYLIFGICSIFIGPILAGEQLGGVIPVITDPLKDSLKYLLFVIAGVSRGVVGRFFLPGFEPRHFEIAASIISFLPIIFLFSVFYHDFKKSNNRRKSLLLTLVIFIFYPYFWAGALRYQFGLKQTLAERYAYPSIFFLVILVTVLCQNIWFDKERLKKRILLVLAAIYVIFQTANFYFKAVEFEKRPLLTKKYFTDLRYVLENSKLVINLPLPSFINQEYNISDLAGVLTKIKLPEFVEAEDFQCDESSWEDFSNERILNFYQNQLKDSFITKKSDIGLFEDCINKIKKRI